MAFRVGVVGMPNSGKSYAWTKYQGDDVFAICPSSKIIHIRTSDNKLLQPIEVKIKGKTFDDLKKEKNWNRNVVIKAAVDNDISIEDVKVKGNYVVCSDVNYVAYWKHFVSRYMPHIKVLLSPDFTHYISYIIQSNEFQKRKSGGEAFARFWELAGDTLRNVILTSDDIRTDMLDFTEYHCKWDSDLERFELFVPAGNMLTEKFIPETYYDLMLYTYIVPYETEEDESKRYKFVVINRDGYSGRGMGLFSDIAKQGMIPNDMNLVVERLRKYLY